MANGVIILVVQDFSMRDSSIEQGISFAAQQLFNIIEVVTFNFVTEALAYLEYTKVDVIISGFTPEDLSGIDFLKLVRNDKNLFHIPFILLGDRISDEDEVKSFLLMANGVLKKPFNFQRIIAKIKGIIDYSLMIKGDNEIKQANSLQEENNLDRFLFEFTQIIYGFMDTPVDIDKICYEMKISRSTLQRKIKQLTGNTLSHQINIIKTKYAKKIIQNTNYPLKIVASMVGFSSISYFNSVYKKIEGETPLKSRLKMTYITSELNKEAERSSTSYPSLPLET